MVKKIISSKLILALYTVLAAIMLLGCGGWRLSELPSLPGQARDSARPVLLVDREDRLVSAIEYRQKPVLQNGWVDGTAFYIKGETIWYEDNNVIYIYDDGYPQSDILVPTDWEIGALYYNDDMQRLEAVAQDWATQAESALNIIHAAYDGGWRQLERYSGNIDGYRFTSSGEVVYGLDTDYNADIKTIANETASAQNHISFYGKEGDWEVFLLEQYREERCTGRYLFFVYEAVEAYAVLEAQSGFYIGQSQGNLEVYECRLYGNKRWFAKVGLSPIQAFWN